MYFLEKALIFIGVFFVYVNCTKLAQNWHCGVQNKSLEFKYELFSEVNKVEIKIKRIRLGMTQADFAKKIKMSRARVVQLERGNYDSLRFYEMKKIVDVLNSTIEELFLKDE